MSGATIYSLTAGLATDWQELRPWAAGAIEFQGTTAGGGIATLETTNDANAVAKSLTPSDLNQIESYTSAQYSRAMYGPMPSFARIKNTGTGTVVCTFGTGMNGKGNSGQVTAVGKTSGGPSSDLFNA